MNIIKTDNHKGVVDYIRSFINLIRYRYKKPKGFPNTSGIINSNYPKQGNGWYKGFVNSPNTCIVAGHSNPSNTTKVFTTTIDGDVVMKSPTKVRINRQYDIAVLYFEDNWPEDVIIHEIGSGETGEWVLTYHQDFKWSLRRLNVKGLEITGLDHSCNIVAGDSGYPWFIERENGYKIVGITSRGDYGVSPNLSNPMIKKWIENE